MQEAGEGELGVFTNSLAVKTGKQRGGGGTIKTLVVVEDFDLQRTPQ
jgi:hypothetical protein